MNDKAKRDIAVGSATAAGMGAGTLAGYHAGKIAYIANETNKNNAKVRSENIASGKLSPPPPPKLERSFKEVKRELKINPKYVNAHRPFARNGMITGAALGGTAALEGARYLAGRKKQEVKKNISAFGVEH